MSFVIDLASLSKEEKSFIIENYTIKSKIDRYRKKIILLRLYSLSKDKKYVILPLGKWKLFYEAFPNTYIYKHMNDTTFTGTLKEKQISVSDEALAILYKKHAVLLALHTGFGKTVISIWLALKLKLKTLIICSIKSLHNQWQERFNEFSNLKIQIIDTKPIDPTADVYVLGAKKTANLSYKDFKDVGTVIVDEVDRICTQTFSLSLHRLRPQFLIGCSATPDRRDGLDKLLYFYFKKNFIFREEIKNFTVIKYSTKFKPDIRYDYSGNLDWTHLQNSLSYNLERHLLICDIVNKYYNNHKIIIMAKRVNEIFALHALLKKRNIEVDYITQNKSNWDNETNVLIGTFSKIGIGLDVTNRDVTILAGDVKDIRQPEGRIRLSNNIIIDIVDDYSTLERHWQQRKQWYLKRGARILHEGEEKKKIVVGENQWMLPDHY